MTLSKLNSVKYCPTCERPTVHNFDGNAELEKRTEIQWRCGCGHTETVRVARWPGAMDDTTAQDDLLAATGRW